MHDLYAPRRAAKPEHENVDDSNLYKGLVKASRELPQVMQVLRVTTRHLARH